MTAAKHKRFLIYYLSSNILSLVFVKAGGETVYVSKKKYCEHRDFFLTFFSGERRQCWGRAPTTTCGGLLNHFLQEETGANQ